MAGVAMMTVLLTVAYAAAKPSILAGPTSSASGDYPPRPQA